MAKVKLRPIQPLELEFADGTVKTALFNNEAFIVYEEEFGELTTSLEDEAAKDPYGAMAKILYCGMKVVDPQITLEEALEITYMGGVELLLEISQAVTENFDLRSNEETKKKFQQTLKDKLTPEELNTLKDMGMI